MLLYPHKARPRVVFPQHVAEQQHSNSTSGVENWGINLTYPPHEPDARVGTDFAL